MLSGGYPLNMSSQDILDGVIASFVFVVGAYCIWLFMDAAIAMTPSFEEHASQIWATYIGGGCLAIGLIFTRGRIGKLLQDS